jgi:hypothetical protein
MHRLTLYELVEDKAEPPRIGAGDLPKNQCQLSEYEHCP